MRMPLNYYTTRFWHLHLPLFMLDVECFFKKTVWVKK